jgi:hypothetical protein
MDFIQVTFSDIGATVSTVESNSREISWACWAGTRAETESLFALMEQLFEGRKTTEYAAVEARRRPPIRELEEEIASRRTEIEAMKSLAGENDEPGESYESSMARIEMESLVRQLEYAESQLSRAQRLLTEEVANADEKWKLRLTVEEKGSSTVFTGNAAELVSKLDPRTMLSLRATYPASGYGEAQIDLRTGTDVLLRVTSPTEDWTSSAYSRMVQEIQKSVPWWAFLRSSVWPSLMVYLATVIAGNLLTARTDFAGALTLWLPLGWAVVALCLSLVTGPLLRRLIPVLEIVDSGAKPRGAVAVGFFGVIVVEIAVGVFVNLVTQAA